MGITNVDKRYDFETRIKRVKDDVRDLEDEKLDKSDVVNDLTTGGPNRPLSAEQGKVLDGKIKGIPTYTHPSTHPATMITEDRNHRFVTDAEKSSWNGKISNLNGVSINRCKASGYPTADVWCSISNRMDLEDWIGDFDARTRENRSKISTKLSQSDVVNDLVSGGTTKALSAEQGKVLSSEIDELKKLSAEYKNRIAAVLGQMDVAGLSTEDSIKLLTQYLEDIPIIGAANSTLTTQGGSYTIPRGYHNGSGRVMTDIANLRPENIKNGANVGGVVGTLNPKINFTERVFGASNVKATCTIPFDALYYFWVIQTSGYNADTVYSYIVFPDGSCRIVKGRGEEETGNPFSKNISNDKHSYTDYSFRGIGVYVTW